MAEINKIDTVIWDFNGTLLNDMQVCIDCMNIMLRQRNLKPLAIELYREIFTFPVRDYYLRLGFDFEKEPFEIPAHQFIDLYKVHLKRAPLHPDVKDVLTFFNNKNIRQVILSAMEQDFLAQTLMDKAILDRFSLVYGIRDHLGGGKTDSARELLLEMGQPHNQICLIGDTIHDYEVAKELGISCVLVAHGHQSYNRLRNLDCQVFHNLSALCDYCSSFI